MERGRKSWLKIHIAYDYTSGQAIDWPITKDNVHDARVFPRLLRGVKGKIEEVIGDSAYDSRKIYQEIEEIGARICHYFGKGPPTQRDKNIDMIALINQWREIGRHQTMPSAS